ncbi:hypothetical protein ACFUN7_22735 [Streptomyces sp. NPDC057236]|uniref:hypothetical protein n=1 Tax=Streptomyces sp. NPDC057236 TaxID=3346059 RepID=UPI003639CECE
MTPTTPSGEPPADISRPRGRHRKPHPRKVLLAAGSLAVAASAVTLVRLAATQGGGQADTGTEAGPRPAPHTATGTPTGSPTASEATEPTPEASPSSPTALGGKNPAPLTASERSAPPRTPAPDTTTTPTAPTGTAPQATHRPPHPSTPRQPPHHTPEPPPPAPHDPTPPQPDAPAPSPRPGLCVPVIGLCVGGGPG